MTSGDDDDDDDDDERTTQRVPQVVAARVNKPRRREITVITVAFGCGPGGARGKSGGPSES